MAINIKELFTIDCALITTDKCMLSQFDKFTIVTKTITFKFCRAHMHGLPCIIGKKKQINNAHVFLLIDKSKGLMNIHPSGHPRKHIDNIV